MDFEQFLYQVMDLLLLRNFILDIEIQSGITLHTLHTCCIRADVGFSVWAFFSRFIWSTHCSAESIGDTLCWARLTDLPQTKEDVQGIAYTHARESSEKKEAQTTYLKQKPANIIYFIFLLEAMHN